MNPFSTKWMPNPPALQRAIANGHVDVSDGPHGRVYVVSKLCPNPDQVKRAIALRNKLESLGQFLSAAPPCDHHRSYDSVRSHNASA